jgi:hypothetical protein
MINTNAIEFLLLLVLFLCAFLIGYQCVQVGQVVRLHVFGLAGMWVMNWAVIGDHDNGILSTIVD